MPLYIDLHVDSKLTAEEVRQCHIADKEIQKKYGVRYIQVLLNQPQGYLFCLVEGPDKETCAKVHQEAHGNVACNVLEITESDFSALLSGKQKDGHDFTINPDGTVDSGVRAILTFSLLGTHGHCEEAKSSIIKTLHQLGGRNTESLESPFTVVFNSCTAAIDAALKVNEQIVSSTWSVELRVGISAGMPLDKDGNFFEGSRKSAGRFAFLSEKSMVMISASARNSYGGDSKLEQVRVLNTTEEKFVDHLFEYLERDWNNNASSINDFAESLGMSKSQLTRKLKTVSSLSPNDLIKEFRLRNSIPLMNGQGMNVAEVTMAVGFSNPSYFTKCFRARFGHSPSDFTSKG